jgi:adenine phosphoribosyltransferase
MNIAGLDRDLPLCPISDKLKIGAFVIFGDPELTTACARELLARCPEHDVLITAESKGIPLICEMARLNGNERYVLARKSAKLYMRDLVKVEVMPSDSATLASMLLSWVMVARNSGPSTHLVAQPPSPSGTLVFSMSTHVSARSPMIPGIAISTSSSMG